MTLDLKKILTPVSLIVLIPVLCLSLTLFPSLLFLTLFLTFFLHLFNYFILFQMESFIIDFNCSYQGPSQRNVRCHPAHGVRRLWTPQDCQDCQDVSTYQVCQTDNQSLPFCLLERQVLWQISFVNFVLVRRLSSNSKHPDDSSGSNRIWGLSISTSTCPLMSAMPTHARSYAHPCPLMPVMPARYTVIIIIQQIKQVSCTSVTSQLMPYAWGYFNSMEEFK